MQYRKCPDCGVNLDPGEICECREQEKSGDAAPLTSPLKNKPTQEPVFDEDSISDEGDIVKSACSFSCDFNLLPLVDGVRDKQLVSAVRELYPKYDKSLHSKVKRGDLYGIDLKPEAVSALMEKYGDPERVRSANPMPPNAPKSRREDRRRLPCRVSCRLSKDDYSELQQAVIEDGDMTMQAWLYRQIQMLLRERS